MKNYNIAIMYSEELKRDVKVYVSLPENYSEENKSYPVLYMNDGQIVFNDYDDYHGRSWGIMESFKNSPNSPELILVGIASGKTRNNELFPFSFEAGKSKKIVGGNAKDYLDFIVNTLKPYINKKYRTLSSPKNTGILGMSVGGVTVTFAATKYSEHFELFGSISTAFMPVRSKMVELVEKSDFSTVQRMYLDVGTKESENENTSKAYVDSNQEMFNVLKEKISPKRLKFNIIEGSQHIEEDWNERFPNIIDFLFKV